PLQALDVLPEAELKQAIANQFRVQFKNGISDADARRYAEELVLGQFEMVDLEKALAKNAKKGESNFAAFVMERSMDPQTFVKRELNKLPEADAATSAAVVLSDHDIPELNGMQVNGYS